MTESPDETTVPRPDEEGTEGAPAETPPAEAGDQTHDPLALEIVEFVLTLRVVRVPARVCRSASGGAGNRNGQRGWRQFANRVAGPVHRRVHLL